MKCRKNVRDLMPAEKAAYVQAIIDLKTTRPSIIAAAQAAGATSRYDDYVWIHREVMGGAHTGPAFTPWHREFLKQFERDLQDVSGDPNLTIPYWDWTTARTAADPGWPFTNDYMGGFGTGADNRVVTGRFAEAGGEWVLHVLTGAGPLNPDGSINPARDNTTYLRRNASPPTPGLPDNFPLPSPTNTRDCLARTAYDAIPYLEDPTTLTLAQLTSSFRKFLEYVLHNGPHGWVGGNMMSMTSPNDPAFFLHHCNIDRLWAVWQQMNATPTTNYLPPSGNTANHDVDDNMILLTSGNFAWPVLARPMDVQDHRAMGFWYASDLPLITLVSPSVSFGNVPETLTTYRPVQFSVRTCRPVKFRITGITAGTNFSFPAAQGIVTVNHSDILDPVIGEVFIQFQALGLLSTAQTATVTIEAFIEDTEGYYVAPPAVEFVVDTYSITLTATPIARPRSAITLVLDRSGSMGANAGGTSTRISLLKTAVQVFADLMHPTDAIGLVCYDDQVNRLMEITPMGSPTTPFGVGRQGVINTLAGSDLDPRGATAIGMGVIEGADVLLDGQDAAATPYDQLAIIVLTDGNENAGQYRVGSVQVQTSVASFSNRVYAIGFGRENEVSATVLGSLSNNPMLTTGDITTAAQQFKLTKYFVQVLAGISNTSIVVDPQGDLLFGAEHKIPFCITEADIQVDVITLCPHALLLDIKLQTPDGTIIDTTTAGPSIVHIVNANDAFYRITLPALPARPQGSHAGTWTAILTISKQKIKELLRNHDNLAGTLNRITGNSIPYSLIVQSYSNIRLAADLFQNSHLPGEELKLHAFLTEYDVPVDHRASVTVEVTDPLTTITYVPLLEGAPGKFKGSYTTTIPGVYECRFKASGYSLGGKAFQREETRTAGIFKQPPGGVMDTSGIDDLLEENRRKFCELLRCLLGNKKLAKQLQRLEIDPKSMIECFEHYCKDPSRQPRETRLRLKDASMANRSRAASLIETEVVKNLMKFVNTTEQLGILASPEPDKIESQEVVVARDRHVHMDTFPIFILEGDNLQRIEFEEHHPGHEHGHDQPGDGKHSKNKDASKGKKKPRR